MPKMKQRDEVIHILERRSCRVYRKSTQNLHTVIPKKARNGAWNEVCHEKWRRIKGEARVCREYDEGWSNENVISVLILVSTTLWRGWWHPISLRGNIAELTLLLECLCYYHALIWLSFERKNSYQSQGHVHLKAITERFILPYSWFLHLVVLNSKLKTLKNCFASLRFLAWRFLLIFTLELDR